jgi:hypothetical protein
MLSNISANVPATIFTVKVLIGPGGGGAQTEKLGVIQHEIIAWLEKGSYEKMHKRQ